jgi:predicted neuraminidase
MSDGALVLAFNDNAERRTPLSIAFSPDESERWTVIRDLEVGDGEFSYPCLVSEWRWVGALRLHLSPPDNPPRRF